MGEKGNVTSDELSTLMEPGSAVTVAADQTGDAVTTVVSGGGTTVVTATALGEKLVDKTIGLGGDEIHQGLKDTRDNAKSRARDEDPPAEAAHEPGSADR